MDGRTANLKILQDRERKGKEMLRLFDQHEIRKEKELNGMWDFVREDNGKAYRLPVPGCWEQHPDMLTYRGQGTYRTKVQVERDTCLRLEFKGVSHTARVFFDGKEATEHYNAYTPFSAVIPGVKAGEHEITVWVDNSFGEHSALHIPNDYYTYGGITRGVRVQEISEVYVERVHFTPECRDGIWAGKTEVVIRNAGSTKASFRISGALGGTFAGTHGENTLEEMTGEVEPGGETILTGRQSFDGITPWTPGEPALYLLKVRLSVDGEVIDDLIERVGFRTVSVQSGHILLNGSRIFMKGFNRHEDHGMCGCAIPLQLMVQDLDLMRDMGANAVRTCHYPNDELFLDLCDERGVLVWEENHARGLDLEHMMNPNFDIQCENCIREMIENHYNHPSIVIWGILNECASETEEGRKKYAAQYAQIGRMDQSRPTTSATCRHFTDICLDLPDVVSFNMYSGWYQDVEVKERHEQEMDWIASAGGAGKPVIVSEFGAAAMYGYRDRGRCKWSEERQADIIRENLEVYQKDSRLSGVFLWQFADCRVSEEGGWFSTRARSHNNKGVVDEYRRPKLAYDTVREFYENWD